MTKETVTLKVGKVVDGVLTVNIVTRDLREDRDVSEEGLILQMQMPAAPAVTAPAADVTAEKGHFSLPLSGGTALESAKESTLLYRAATDNDTDPMFANTMAPYLAQREEVLSSVQTGNGWKVVTRITNRKAMYQVTDTYEGTADGSILVTSRIHCQLGGGILPRFGKCFQLPVAFDQVTYTGRTGESYCDMKDQFPVGTVSCRVKDMTEPNIRPQESGNRCDCTCASFSDGTSRVTFRAVEAPFELSVKPYTDRALAGMKHREDEVQTGVYVTIEAFQEGIGTGACGPAIMPEYTYSAKKDYTLKFLITRETI